jgi:hypothetical protein
MDFKIGDIVKFQYLKWEIKSLHSQHWKYVYLVPIHGNIKDGYLMVTKGKLHLVKS